MDTYGRPSSLLPSIKCSNCSAEIEISRMGDHVCSSAPEVPASSSARPWMDRGRSSSSERRRQDDNGYLSAGRMPPSRYESPSGTRPSGRQEQRPPYGAPSNFNNGRGPSPMARNDSGSLPFRNAGRAPQAPPPRQYPRPPSLELSNLDCAFPPFPMANSPARSTPTEVSTPFTTTPDNGLDKGYAEASSMYKPMSPKSNGSGSVLKRMDSIAPGPFDIGARRGPSQETRSNDQAGLGHRRQKTLGGSKDYTTRPDPSGSKGHFQRPSTAGSERSQGSYEGRGSERATGSSHRRVPTLGDGTMTTRGATPDKNLSRRGTPVGEDISRRGTPVGGDISRRGTPAEDIPRRGTPNGEASRRPPAISDRSLAFRSEAEKPSLFRNPFRLDSRSQTFPLREEDRSPGHAPSGPLPRRPSGPRTRRPTKPTSTRPTLEPDMYAPSATSGRNPFVFELDGEDEDKTRPTKNAKAGNRPDFGSDRAPVKNLPQLADDYTVGNPYHTPTESQSSNGSGYGSDTKTGSSRSTPPLPDTHDRMDRRPSENLTIESPRKPDFRAPFPPSRPAGVPGELMKKLPSLNRSREGPASKLGGKELPREPLKSPANPAMDKGPYLDVRAEKAPNTAPLRRAATGPPERRTATSKGNCRGCGELIKGKSVSSADGRLTGRYHKQCFVCRTCMEPFETATFYVINNHPYCERHYHKLNNSVCQACDHGIEGQYLETEKKQKYHSVCFTCRDCRKTLQDEYFEMNGKVYCELHAFRRAQQNSFAGSGRKNPERRTTRMMMMI